MPVNCASWSITTTPISASAASACCWVCRRMVDYLVPGVNYIGGRVDSCELLPI